MADWDQNSQVLFANLKQLLRQIRDSATKRDALDPETMRGWHLAMMAGLALPPGVEAGAFRGEPGLEGCEVYIGRHRGTRSAEVAGELAIFGKTLSQITACLDSHLAPDPFPDEDTLAAVIDACAWGHSEWIRIHPFPNGNGRTARLLANALAMRYGLPPFVRLRPRPGVPYGAVASASMKGDRTPTVVLFHELLDDALK